MDETDRDIILALLDREQTAHQLAKTLYKTTDVWELRRHYSFLRYRLGRLAEDGLVRKRVRKRRAPVVGERQGSTYYVPLEDMASGKAKLVIENGTGTTTLDVGQVLVTETKDGDRRILILDDLDES